MEFNWKKIGIITASTLGAVILAGVAIRIAPTIAISIIVGGVLGGVAGFIGGRYWTQNSIAN